MIVIKFEDKYKKELAEMLVDENKISYFYDSLCLNKYNNYTDCMAILNELLLYCENNNLMKAKVKTLYRKGWLYLNTGEFETAVNVFTKMQELVQRLDYEEGLLSLYNAYVSLYCEMGEYAISKQYGVRGLSLARKLEDHSYYIKILINMAITNLNRGAYTEAVNILNYTKDIMTPEDGDNFCFLHKSLAEVHILLDNIELAESSLKKAYAYVIEIENNILMSEILKISGMLKVKKKDYVGAEKNYSDAIILSNKYGFEYEKLRIELERVKLFLITGDEEAFLVVAKAVKSKARSLLYRVIASSVDELLYKYYNNIGKTQEALENLEEIVLLKTNRQTKDFNVDNISYDVDFTVDSKQILYDRSEVLFDFSNYVLSELNFNNIRDALNNEMRKIFIVNIVGIGYIDEEDGKMKYSNLDKTGKITEQKIDINENSCFLTYCVKNNRVVLVKRKSNEYFNYLKKFELKYERYSDLQSAMFIPIANRNKSFGVIELQTEKKNEYNFRDINFMKSIAAYIGIALKNIIEYEKLERVAMYDSLTGFLSRREILKLGENLTYLRLEGIDEGDNAYIGMIDIDNFKTVNDNFGHVAGDMLLKLVAKMITMNVRTEDSIGRYGGDEFLVISENITEKDVYSMLDRIRLQIEEAVFNLGDGIECSITISVGLHKLKSEENEFKQSVNLADAALYRVKKENKNEVFIL